MRGLLLIAALVCACAGEQFSYDVVVYGATAAGVTSAIQAARANVSVALVNIGTHVGGMVSGGLGHTDTGNTIVIGGLAHEFFVQVGQHYGSKNPVYSFEPHVAENVFAAWLKDSKVVVLSKSLIVSAKLNGATASSVTLENGDEISAKVFIDSTYEGELLKLFKVSYTYGRESSSQYKESFAGRLEEPTRIGGHQFSHYVDPYFANGTLLPLIYDGDVGEPGEADKKVQAYNWRLCLTQRANNSVPIPAPKNYDPERWELLRRYIKNMTNPSLGNFMGISGLPNGKTDVNNNGPISTDYIGGSWAYVEASWAEKAKITEDHKQYTLELFHFLANDPASPEALQHEAKSWGLAKDEFVDTENWPHQLYVREARRMIGEYVMMQADRHINITKYDTIGMGSYNIDTHNCQRIPQKSPYGVVNDGDVEQSFSNQFQIPYRALVPKIQECTNLIVPVCLSASHIGYAPIRLEPQFMILGQSAGLAAAEAILSKVAVQKINIEALQLKLKQAGQILSV